MIDRHRQMRITYLCLYTSTYVYMYICYTYIYVHMIHINAYPQTPTTRAYNYISSSIYCFAHTQVCSSKYLLEHISKYICICWNISANTYHISKYIYLDIRTYQQIHIFQRIFAGTYFLDMYLLIFSS